MGFQIVSEPYKNPESIKKVFTEKNVVTNRVFEEKGSISVGSSSVDSLKDKLSQIESFTLEVENDDLPANAKINSSDPYLNYQSNKKYPPEVLMSGALIDVGGKAKLTVPPNEGRVFKTTVPNYGECTILEFEINGGKVFLPINKNDINVVKDQTTGKTYYIDLTEAGEVNVHVEQSEKKK